MAAVLWNLGDQTLDLTARAIIMGVLNVTPDSFSDGGEFFEHGVAIEQARRMVDDGAHIIDVGGESTRPGSEGVTEEEELRRVLPVIDAIKSAAAPALISIDTTKASVAAAALDAGATIINDISGGRADQEMMPLAADRGAAFIVMHMQGTPRTMQLQPQYDDVVGEVREFFRQQYACAIQCGIKATAIAFDPGIGFGKTLQHNLELLRNLAQLRIEDRPLVVGVSRKAFLGRLSGASEMADRVAPTIAMTALLRERGANVIRVHDVKANAAALRTTEALLAETR
jgi:dihydropteroate synthase